MMANHCLLTQDFRRAGAEYASAIFIIAPKYPEDPTTADRYLSMCALSLGQYLQEVHVSMEERLSHTPKRVMHWIKHGTVRAPHLPPRLLFSCCGLTSPNALVLAFMSSVLFSHSIIMVDGGAASYAEVQFRVGMCWTNVPSSLSRLWLEALR
jgi:hypothetical protein